MLRKLSLIPLLLLAASAPSLLSGETLYSNLPNGSGWAANIDAYTVNSGYIVSNSFDLAAASVLQGVEFLSWTNPGDFITSIDWIISDGDIFNGLGTVYGSGTALSTSSFQFTNSVGFDVSLNTFGLPNLNLGAGTYFLSLLNAVTDQSEPAYWDQNDGPSEAWHSELGSLAGVGTGSHSFSITGTTSVSSVPEPTTWALFGAGVVVLAIRRKSRVSV